MSTRTFLLLDPTQIEPWLARQKVARNIVRIQNHHSRNPRSTQFAETNHQRLLYGMEALDIERGYTQIAQHFTTFPDGTIGVGRPLNQIPAGIPGANAMAISIVHIGDFDAGQDVMRPEQREALLMLNALLCRHFGLLPSIDSIVYRHWYDAETGERTDGAGVADTSPGTAFFGGNTIEACQAGFIPEVTRRIQQPSATNLPEPPDIRYVLPLRLNMRAGATIAGAIVGVLQRGTAVRVFDIQNGWARLSATSEYWVFGKALSRQPLA